MFDDADAGEDYLYSAKNEFTPQIPSSKKKIKKHREFVLFEMPKDAMSKKRQRQLEFAEHYRRENARLRKPCPHCATLVQPHLLEQHYDAYHPDVPVPVVKAAA